MNWRSVKFDWNRAKAFLVTAEEGSLSAAARALGVTQPTLSRQVEALEAELNIILFERVGRRLVLTPAGMELLKRVRTMGEAATEVSLSAMGQSRSTDGPICITATDVYSAFLLPPIVVKLRAKHPGLRVEIVASDSLSDLRRREADIAVRNVASTQPDLIVRKIRDDMAHLYATEAYLQSIGCPQTVADLEGANFLGVTNHNDLIVNLLNSKGIPVTEQNFSVVSDSLLVGWELVKFGAGIGYSIEAVGDAEPKVRRVLPAMEPIVVPMWLTVHRELNTSVRVRTVFDFLVSELSHPKAPSGKRKVA